MQALTSQYKSPEIITQGQNSGGGPITRTPRAVIGNTGVENYRINPAPITDPTVSELWDLPIIGRHGTRTISNLRIRTHGAVTPYLISIRLPSH